MIEYTTGDIFQCQVEAIVNPTNCVGPMGAGLAKQFDQRYPQNTKAYKALCRRGQIRPGTLVWSPTGHETPSWIVNLPTKDHYREPSQLEYVRAGIISLKRELTARGTQSIALPALGAGLGRLRWEDVRRIISEEMREIEDCRIVVLEPHGR